MTFIRELCWPKQVFKDGFESSLCARRNRYQHWTRYSARILGEDRVYSAVSLQFVDARKRTITVMFELMIFLEQSRLSQRPSIMPKRLIGHNPSKRLDKVDIKSKIIGPVLFSGLMGSVIMDINVAVVVRSSPTQYNSVAPLPPSCAVQVQVDRCVPRSSLIRCPHLFRMPSRIPPEPLLMPRSHLSQDVGR